LFLLKTSPFGFRRFLPADLRRKVFSRERRDNSLQNYLMSRSLYAESTSHRTQNRDDKQFVDAFCQIVA
jgi:hypothetical protein